MSVLNKWQHGERNTFTENFLERNLIVLVIGIIAGALFAIPMAYSVKKDAFEHGRGVGYVEGVQFAITSLAISIVFKART